MNKKELRRLSKKELLQLVAEQQQEKIRLLEEENKLLREKLAEFERLLESFDNPHTPSSKKRKKNTEKKEGKLRFPGKPPGSGGGGIKLPPPDKVVEHTLENCPDCHNHLGNPTKKTKKTVIDLPEKLAITTEHHIDHYHCENCDKEVSPNVQLPEGIYGQRVQSMIALLKDNTLSCEKTAGFLRELGFPTLSSPLVLSVLVKFSGKLKNLRQSLLYWARKEPYLHADETGFRRDGKNGYVWGIFSKTISILSAQMSRAGEHIKNLLGNFTGVLVTDGYGGYDYYPLRQRCCVHLLREFKELTKKHKDIEPMYTRMKILYEQMKIQNKEPPNETKIEEFRWTLDDIRVCLDAVKHGRKLATLIKNGGDDWFTALYHPDVPLENNHAERGLRHIVLQRKMMGCYRNEKGKNWIDVVTSVLQSWRLQGKNVYQELCAVA